MFKVQVGEDEYEVEFTHYNPGDLALVRNLAGWGEYDFGTDCAIFSNKNHWIGETILHPLDQHSYNKNTGRKMALARALQQAFPGEENKELRGVFWMEYYKARGNRW